jgi:hypothetical protein
MNKLSVNLWKAYFEKPLENIKIRCDKLNS